MNIELREITVRELSDGFKDDAENGVVGYGGRAISNIENNLETYDVSVDGKIVVVEVAKLTEKNGTVHKYLKTKPDDFKPNNLINLPTCP